MKLLKAISYVRFAPFDQQTEQGRSDERYRVAVLAILANVLSRVAGLGLMLLSVGLTLPYLGAERFGIWMTIASFAAMLTFLDLGVGNALTNHVANRAALSDLPLLRKTISGGLGFLTMIGTCIGAALWILAYHLPWEKIIKVTNTTLIPEVRYAAMCFAVLFGLNIIASGVTRVYAGLQQAYKAHLVTTFTTILACVVIWYAAETQQGIVVLLAIVLGAQIFAGFLLFCMLIAQSLFTFNNFIYSSFNESRFLIRVGGLFLLLQIGTMVGWGADSLIIASTLGAAQVAIFAVVQRIFHFASMPLSIINAPLWPAYADAHARGDKVFIKKTLRKSMLMTFAASTLAAIILLAVHPWLIQSWTQGAITAAIGFVALFAVWTILESCGNAFAMFLNGTGVIGLQVKVTTVFVLVALPLKMVLVQYFGITGIIASTIFAYITCVVAVYAYIFKNEILGSLKVSNE